MTPYAIGDLLYKELSQKIQQLFTKVRLMDFDEINSVKVGRTIRTLYEQIDRLSRDAFIVLSEMVWKQIIEEEEEDEDDLEETPDIGGERPAKMRPDRKKAEETVRKQLESYDTPLKYRWDNEIERKRERLFEMIMADSDKGKREARRKDYDTAERYILRQIRQTLIDIEDATVADAFEELDVRYVQWVAQDDERTCQECYWRHLAVYELSNVPEKHIGCRCYLLPVTLPYE